MEIVDLDMNSPAGRRGAEIARQLITARLTGDNEIGNATLTEAVQEVQNDLELQGALLFGLAHIAATAISLAAEETSLSPIEFWQVMARIQDDEGFIS